MINVVIVLCGIALLLLDRPVEACSAMLLAIFWKLDEIKDKLK